MITSLPVSRVTVVPLHEWVEYSKEEFSDSSFSEMEMRSLIINRRSSDSFLRIHPSNAGVNLRFGNTMLEKLVNRKKEKIVMSPRSSLVRERLTLFFFFLDFLCPFSNGSLATSKHDKWRGGSPSVRNKLRTRPISFMITWHRTVPGYSRKPETTGKKGSS